MSQVKRTTFGLIFILAMVSLFVFGCEKSTPVDDISFNLTEGEQIVLMVGETLELQDYISIKPGFATNQKYSLSSFNNEIVEISGKSIIAVSEGVTQIKVTADDNSLKEDLMTVLVKKDKTILSTPKNLSYDNQTQSFKFDAVPYATSYTFSLNGVEYNIGNSNVFDLNQYKGKFQDELLVVRVRANAPSYTYAFDNSSYSQEYKVYQASDLKNVEIKNGVLSFEKSNSSLKANVYLNGTLLFENTADVNLSLKDLNEQYAGKNLEVEVETVVGDEIKEEFGDNVLYFNSPLKTLNVNVLDVPSIEFNTTILSWPSVVYASGYAISVDGDELTITQNNYFDLLELQDYSTIFADGDTHEIEVAPLVGENSINVGKTTKEGSIFVKKLNNTTVSCDGKIISWETVENATYYLLTLTQDANVNKFSVMQTTFAMNEYEAGDYILTVQPFAGDAKDGNGVYYLPADVTTFNFDKMEEINAKIEDYVLSILNIGSDSCLVEFENESYNETVDANKTEIDLSSSDYQFDAGVRSITLKRLGDSNSIESDVEVKNFTQLEKIEKITISNGAASVNRSEINENAGISFVTTGAGLSKPLTINADSFTYNTINKEDISSYLSTGTYETSVYVYGDGSSTFSYRENGNVVACAVALFEVLSAPTLELKNSSQEVLSISEVENASSYNVYLVGGESPKVEGLTCNFDLQSGTGYYYVQAKGNATNISQDGSMIPCYLDSCYSDQISVTRLETPTMNYNSETGILSRNELKDLTNISGYEFAKNGVVEPFTFPSSFTSTDDVSLTLTDLAKLGEKGSYYLNSLPFELNLTKISNDATISLDENNNLIIAPVEHVEEYSLVVKIDVGSNVYTFTTIDNKLVSGSIELDYTYSSKKYVIDLIENYNTIIDDMGESFDVEVWFVKPSTGNDLMINSDVVSESLTLVRVDNESTITVNNENEIVISPLNHSKEYGLILVINNDPDLTFKSDGTNLVSNDVTLSYVYKQATKSYYVTIIDNKYNKLNNVFNFNFVIKVKYINNIDATETDLDSDFTENKTIYVLPASSLTRDGQTLKIENIKATYTYQNYALFINESYLLNLDEHKVTVQESYIVIDANYIFDNTPVAKLEEINSIEVVVLNNESSNSYPCVSTKSDKIYIEKAQALELKSDKDNNSENNSVVVWINPITTSYEKEYVFELYNSETKQVKRFVDSDVVDGVISFNLDDISLSGTIYVNAYINTTDDYVDTNTIYVFNSNNSNVLNFVKISNTKNLIVSNSILSFDAISNAVGYEIYEKVSGGYSKINTTLLTTNQYEFTTFTGEKEIVVKAISKVGEFTNSGYSDSIKINKLAMPNLSVENGNLLIVLDDTTLDLATNDKIQVVLEINNTSTKVEIDLSNLPIGVQLRDTTLICEPQIILSYNSASLILEELTVQSRVEYSEAIDDVYYLNSNIAGISVYGLFAPTEVEKIASDNETIEQITWTASNKNVLNSETINVKYLIKIEYTFGGTTKTYYSNDIGLKYYDKTQSKYVSYPTNITGTSVMFPAGYDEDNNGVLDVEFVEGSYKISVQAIPTSTISGVNLCSSQFSIPYEFTILNKTILSIKDGIIVWPEQSKASRYEVAIYKQDETEAIVTDTVYDPYYDFTGSETTISNKLKGLTGVLRVEVQAISTTNDTVNSKTSDPLYVYRLPEVSSISVDDGYLILESTLFFKTAKIEFVNVTTGTIYTHIFDNTTLSEGALTLLNLTTWKGFSDNDIINDTTKNSIQLNDEALSVLDGGDYTINVTLFGNSNTSLGFVNSSKSINTSSLTASKLKPNVVEVSLGVIKYLPHSNYATITGGTYTSDIDFNYSFNGATSSAFWNNTALYKIEMKHAGGVEYIYAVDYYSFITYYDESVLSTSDYEIVNYDNGFYAVVKYPYAEGILYFNVYLNNIINLKDFDTFNYYASTETMTLGENKFESSSTIKTIDFSESGSFTISISMMGGDSKLVGSTLVGHLNSGVNELKTFVRYGANQLTSKNGLIQFDDLKPIVDGTGIDNPIYKLDVTNLKDSSIQIFYLYYDLDADSERDAKTIAGAFDNNYLSAIYAPLVIDEDFEDVLFFDLSEYIDIGTYKITIRTLAGLGVSGEEFDYLLNAREPSVSYTFYKLTDTEFNSEDGVLKFEQSYIINDGSKIYYDNYEVTLINTLNSKEYIYQIGRNSDGVKFNDTTHVVTYTLPAQLTIESNTFEILENVEYKIKIKAISTLTGDCVLNGTHKKSDGTDVELKFKKSLGISEIAGEKLRIENGILKWKVIDPDSHTYTIIRVSFLDENSQEKNIYITVGNLNKVVENGVYKYHYYEFTDSTYPFDTTGSDYLFSGITYNITACLIGQKTATENILNSNYSSICSTERLNEVDASSIKSSDGILTWDAVDNAESYKITISGNTEYVLTSNTNVLDLSLEHLAVGTYSVKIKALGNSYINAMMSEAVAGFTQLDIVDISSVKIEGSNIIWDEVSNAQGYKVKFSYTDLSGAPQVSNDIVYNNAYTAPGGISGKFTITISAVGVGSGKVFNGKSIEYTSSSDAPMHVQNITFDKENSRFNIDVNSANFFESDELVIVYNFARYTSQGVTSDATLETKTISYKQSGRYEQIDSNTTRYYYPINEMGVYSNISVQVSRPNTLPSNAVQTEDVDFKLFSFGAGTESDMYRIYNAEQLLNIPYFPSAHYILTSSINMASVDIQERLNTYGAIIASEFSGVLDGGSLSISGFVNNTNLIAISNIENFALFGSLNGATIKNLIISELNVQLSLTNEGNSVGNIKLSLLASRVNNSNIENINLTKFSVKLESTQTTNYNGKIYIGSLAAEMTNSTLSNSIINMSININMLITRQDNAYYIGGVASTATISNVNSSQINFALESKAENLFTYVGGVIAYYVGKTSKLTGFSSTTVEFNMTNVQSVYVGGMVGFARYININSCKTTGSYSKQNIAYYTYIGGIVGCAQSSTIQSSGSFIDFSLSISNYPDEKYIGAIAGIMTVQNSITCTMQNCYSNVYDAEQEQTYVSTSEIIVGMYGSATGTNITVSGNYKKEK